MFTGSANRRICDKKYCGLMVGAGMLNAEVTSRRGERQVTKRNRVRASFRVRFMPFRIVTPSTFSNPPLAMQITVSRNIAAIQIERAEDGQEKLGVISQLPQGAALDICGEGFNSRTVKVGWRGQHYFVFIQDLRDQASAARA
jgi:hypothetical protein